MSVHRRVVVSPEAEEDFEDILTYGRRRWGERRAVEYAAAIFGAMEDLSRFPKIGRERPELFPGARVRSVGQHLIVYRIDGMTVNVVRILHGHMDVPHQSF